MPCACAHACCLLVTVLLRLHLLPLPLSCCCWQVGKRHDLSAGLLIGGKAVAEEASRVNAMNILVATPGGRSWRQRVTFSSRGGGSKQR